MLLSRTKSVSSAATSRAVPGTRGPEPKKQRPEAGEIADLSKMDLQNKAKVNRTPGSSAHTPVGRQRPAQKPATRGASRSHQHTACGRLGRQLQARHRGASALISRVDN